MQTKSANVTRANIALDLRKKFKFTRAESKKIVDSFFNILSSSFFAGKRVEIRGFGSFDVIERKQKIGRNPRAPEMDLIVVAKKDVKFSLSDKIELKFNPVSKLNVD